MKYTTCVSVAESDIKSMSNSLEAALARSSYAEVRLDYLRPSDIPGFLEMASSHMGRVICTIRPVVEGGRFDGDEDTRLSLLGRASQYRPYLLDVEFQTLEQNPGMKFDCDVMVSWHDFTGTPDAESLERRLALMSRHSGTVKMVVTARRGPDAASILGLYGVRGETTLVAFAMGEQAAFSRLCAMHLGCPFMYVSLGKPTAPGQYSLDYVRGLDDAV